MCVCGGDVTNMQLQILDKRKSSGAGDGGSSAKRTKLD